MNIAIVKPPMLHGLLHTVEDCCYGVMKSNYLPSMVINIASQNKSIDFIDLTIDHGPFSQYDYVIVPVNYARNPMFIMNYVEDHFPDTEKILIAMPGGYGIDLAKEYDPYAVIYSEPEYAVREIGKPHWKDHTNGVIFKDRGHLSINPRESSSFAFQKPVDYSKVPKHYWEHYPMGYAQLSRGCAYRCPFCTWGGSMVTDPKYSILPPQAAARAIWEIEEHSGRQIPLILLSSQLTTHNGWLEGFYHSMKYHPHPYSTYINIAEFKEEHIEYYKGSGCIAFQLGVEALSEPMLRRIKKPHTVKKAIEVINILKKYDIPFGINLRWGMGETDEEIKESLKTIGELNIPITSFGPLISYKGTILYESPLQDTTDHMFYHGCHLPYEMNPLWLGIEDYYKGTLWMED